MRGSGKRPAAVALLEQYADGGGELLVCTICFSARKLEEDQLASNARLAGATPLWEWIGADDVTVFSYSTAIVVRAGAIE